MVCGLVCFVAVVVLLVVVVKVLFAAAVVWCYVYDEFVCVCLFCVTCVLWLFCFVVFSCLYCCLH